MNKKVPCIILARKNSKSVKNKNIIRLKNLTLIEHTIKYLQKSKFVDDIVVSTDDKKIANISKKYNCFIIYPRPRRYSSDKATTEIALKHALKIYENKKGATDIVTYVQVTEVFKPPYLLDKCIKKLIKNKNLDSCFVAYEQHKNFWIKKKRYLSRISPINERYKPRQIKKPIFREDTGHGLATRSKIIRKGERIGHKVNCVSYKNPLYSFDLNSKDDLKLIKKLIN